MGKTNVLEENEMNPWCLICCPLAWTLASQHCGWTGHPRPLPEHLSLWPSWMAVWLGGGYTISKSEASPFILLYIIGSSDFSLS